VNTENEKLLFIYKFRRYYSDFNRSNIGGKKISEKQNKLLNKARKNNDKVKIYLVSGNQLEGTIEGFDNFSVTLNINGKKDMIYKHAISTVVF